jgi:membrane-bound ClpP family serine protease
MILAIILLVIGLFFIFIEFYLPGGIMAILGIITLLASIVVFAQQADSIAAVALFIWLLSIFVVLVIKYTLQLIQKSRGNYSIYLHKDQEGYKASKFDASAIGKVGIVCSDLKPAGYIMIEGKKYQAISITGYIPQGQEVVVLRGEEESLVVKIKSAL